ncbi:MAG TPA: ATP-binding protein [Acidiferrobacteraceae bacterium]|nr:ATP-binding protein [Acidiferrobacteraceae bacterium]
MTSAAPCILVVDDNPGNRYVVAHALRRDGFRILEAHDGAGALRALDERPALVVLDVHLPDISGIEVCQHIRSRQHFERVPILHVSAERVSGEDQAYGLDQGADGYLTYPIAPEVLRSTVRALLRARGAEHALRMERERLAATLENVADGVVTTDLQWRIVTVSGPAAALIGRAPEDLLDKGIGEVLRLEDLPGGLDDIPGEEERRRLTARVSTRQTPVEIMMAPIRMPPAPALGRVLVFRDLTEQRRAEDAMIVAQKLESIGALAAGIAHDFNNMLTAVLGNVSLARLAGGASEDLLVEAEHACLRARTLANRLLTFAKGGAPVKKLGALGAVLVDAAEFAARGSKAQCVYELPQDLPEVEMDTHQISQVVHNLVVNAVEAMPQGGVVRITAKVGRGPKGRRGNRRFVAFTVSDRGAGIDASHLSRIFDPYFSTKARGSGLGLTVVYSIVQKHGGFVEVDSKADQGTRVTVHLPVNL